MDNATRAARLAELGYLRTDYSTYEARQPEIYNIPGKHWYQSADGMMAEGELMLWLLRELPKRELWWQLETKPDDGGFRADICDGKDEYVNGRCVGAQVYAAGHPTDPLIALVDAVIAAHAERQAT